MCWRDSILGKFQLSGFFFLIELIQSLFHLEFPTFLKQKQKQKKPRSTITYNEDLDENKKGVFFLFLLFIIIIIIILSFFSRSTLATQTNLIFKIHLSHSKPVLTLSSRNAISLVEFDSLQVAIKLNPPMTFKNR